MTSIPTIASKLSDDVRVALLDAQPLDGEQCLHWSTAGTVVRACRVIGLIVPVGKCLTPLGLSIRTHLQKEASK